MKFAVYFGNRGFFPGELIAGAISDFNEVLAAQGHEAVVLENSGNRYDAVETPEEGRRFAALLKANPDVDGILLSLPNFGDENGALAALRGTDLPILVQAYPDEIGLMDFSHRRDAVCGKIAMCNVLRQAGIRFSLTKKFAVHPKSADFAEDLRVFAGTCRCVKGMRRFSIGAIGARTTAFKTVRYDEIAYERKGIGIETIDMSLVFKLMDAADPAVLDAKRNELAKYAEFGDYPAEKLDNQARFAVAIDSLIAKYSLGAVAIRCWDELQTTYGIAPCASMAMLNEKGIPAACEMDVNNAVMMRALSLASDSPVGLFDVNNNYGGASDRCIFFHCAAIPGSMLKCRACVAEHKMFIKAYGKGSGVGILNGEMKPMPLTIGSFKTEDGALFGFVSSGEATGESLEKEFFGVGFVFKKDGGDIDGMLNYMARNGYRHHVAFVNGDWSASIEDSFRTYLGYNLDIV